MPTQESSIPQKETPKKSIQYTDLSFPSLLLPKTFTRAINDICKKLTAEKRDGQSQRLIFCLLSIKTTRTFSIPLLAPTSKVM